MIPHSTWMFQSLFRWITFPDQPLLHLRVPVIPGFNPCSAGSPSPTRLNRLEKREADRFQSLFRWITFPDPGRCREPGDVTLFQSLFRWITFPDICDRLLSPGLAADVSILVPLDHLPRRVSLLGGRGGGVGFNPCSAGSPSPTAAQNGLPRSEDVVSILVPLDHLPRRPDQGGGRCHCLRVSILVPLDHLPRLVFVQSVITKLLSFNPCSAGSPSPTLVSRPLVQRGQRGFNPCSAGSPSPTRIWDTIEVIEFPSFNPCSAGSPSPTEA